MLINIVPDTNIILKGMFGYRSAERQLLNLALAKKIVLYGSKETFDEFCEKVHMPRFKRFWDKKIFSPEKIILDYKSLINMVEPSEAHALLNIPIRDPDDAIFFKVAKSCGAKIIISHDKDVLEVKKYDDIITVNAEKFIEKYNKRYPNPLA